MSTKIFGQDLNKIRLGITKGLTLWADSIRSTLPQSVQNKIIVGDEQIIVTVYQDTLSITQNQQGITSLLGEFNYGSNYYDPEIFKMLTQKITQDQELILAVSEDKVLSKKVDFPSSVASNLRQTLYYELDKHTPFQPEQILYDIGTPNEVSGKVFTQLYILHKPIVINLLEKFAEHNLYFNRLCTQTVQEINLLPDNFKKKQRIFKINKNYLLLFFASILILIALATPLYFKRQTAIKLDQEIARLMPRADGEITLWEQRDNAEQTLLTFLESHPLSFAQYYEELAKQLPDDTWVNNFNLQNGKVYIRGESPDAAALINVINSNPLFTHAQIASPIVKSRGNNKESFYIIFELVSAGENTL